MVAMPIPVEYNSNDSLNHLRKSHYSKPVTNSVFPDPFSPKHECSSDYSENVPPIGIEASRELVSKWVQAAITFAIVHRDADDDVLTATIRGIQGAWGYGNSPSAAIDDLRSVLHGWVELKLEDEDDDIPIISGVNVYAV